MQNKLSTCRVYYVTPSGQAPTPVGAGAAQLARTGMPGMTFDYHAVSARLCQRAKRASNINQRQR